MDREVYLQLGRSDDPWHCATCVRSRLAGRSPPSIIAFTESWLDNTVSDGEICIPGYKVYRKDRNRNGGGIVLFVDEELRRTDLESTDLEAVWLEIRERANRRALIGVIYRPPSSDSRFMVDLADTLQLIRTERGCHTW